MTVAPVRNVPRAVRSAQRRTAHYRARLASAQTAEQQAAEAWDWYRGAVSAMPAGARAGLLREIAQVLADHAVKVERSHGGDSA